MLLLTITAFQMGYLPILAVIKPLLGTKFMEKYGGAMAAAVARLNDYCAQVMDDRIERENEDDKKGSANRKDLAHYLIKSRDPETGKSFTRTELQAEAVLLVVAGADTSSTTLAATIFYLLRYPHVMRRLAAEIRPAFSNVDDIRIGQTINSLPYLRAVIDETLRMSPPVPGHLPREILPGGLEIDGHYIPGGTQVGVSAYALHHNEDYYPDSFSYKPERWIADPETGVTEADVTKARDAFCAFSLGNRGCIGKSLAYVELSITIARLVWLYDIREAEGEKIGEGKNTLGFGRARKNEYQIGDRFVAQRDGPIIEVKRRAAAAAA
jgi:cytochrome P450